MVTMRMSRFHKINSIFFSNNRTNLCCSVNNIIIYSIFGLRICFVITYFIDVTFFNHFFCIIVTTINPLSIIPNSPTSVYLFHFSFFSSNEFVRFILLCG